MDPEVLLWRALRAEVQEHLVRHEQADIPLDPLDEETVTDFYIDCLAATLNGETLWGFADVVLDEMTRLGATAVGGPMAGAALVVGAAIGRIGGSRNVKGFLVRRRPNPAGLGKLVEGPDLSNERALLVTDVFASGRSMVRAAEAVRREWPSCQIAGALALVDREEGGAEAVREAGIPLKLILTRHDL